MAAVAPVVHAVRRGAPAYRGYVDSAGLGVVALHRVGLKDEHHVARLVDGVAEGQRAAVGVAHHHCVVARRAAGDLARARAAAYASSAGGRPLVLVAAAAHAAAGHVIDPHYPVVASVARHVGVLDLALYRGGPRHSPCHGVLVPAGVLNHHLHVCLSGYICVSGRRLRLRHYSAVVLRLHHRYDVRHLVHAACPREDGRGLRYRVGERRRVHVDGRELGAVRVHAAVGVGHYDLDSEVAAGPRAGYRRVGLSACVVSAPIVAVRRRAACNRCRHHIALRARYRAPVRRRGVGQVHHRLRQLRHPKRHYAVAPASGQEVLYDRVRSSKVRPVPVERERYRAHRGVLLRRQLRQDLKVKSHYAVASAHRLPGERLRHAGRGFVNLVVRLPLVALARLRVCRVVVRVVQRKDQRVAVRAPVVRQLVVDYRVAHRVGLPRPRPRVAVALRHDVCVANRRVHRHRHDVRVVARAAVLVAQVQVTGGGTDEIIRRRDLHIHA